MTPKGSPRIRSCAVKGCLIDKYDAFQKKEAVEQLRAIYPDEGKNAELDMTAQFKVR